MMAADTERWRSYFRKAGVDIWTVIHQAIHVAAIDFPKDFRHMRGEIAETLFSRELVRWHSTHVDEETACTFEEVKVGKGIRQAVEMQAEATDLGNDDLERHRRICHNEAEALMDEPEEEHFVVEEVNIIKEACIGADQPEITVYEALHKLKYMNITVQVLEVTEIAKKVKGLRKHPSARVSVLAKELVSHWKRMAIEWMDAAEEATAATATTTDATECGEFSKEEGLSLPPLDGDALLETRASSVELSQLFSFIDEDMCGGRFNERETPVSSVEPALEKKPNRFSLSQSGSMLTDCSDFDDHAHKWGLKMAEERGSATRDRIELCERETTRGQKEANGRANHNGLNNAPKCFGPGRPEFDTPRVDFTSSTGKSPGNLTSGSRSSLLPTNVAAHTKNSSIATMKSDKNLADQKLEIAKRKLHKGYAEAENAKKQRTVQVLDVSDIPKSGQAVKTRVNSSVQTKSGSQRGFLSQNGRHS